MKKKCLKTVSLAAVLVMVPALAFGAGSVSLGGGGNGVGHATSTSSGTTVTAGMGQSVQPGGTAGSGNTASGTTQVVTSADGSKTSITSAVTDPATGYVHALVVNTADSEGRRIEDGGNGMADVTASNAKVYLAAGESKTAGLPAGVVSTIQAVDNGTISAVPGLNTQGYHKVSQSMAIVNESAASGQVQVSNVEIKLYCSNIPASGTLAILFYNNATGTYQILPATSYDLDSQTVCFVVPTSGTAWILAK